ncbi:HNH endonuclease [Polynucleobacter paneuropaeus]|jgi:hypothetical protein|nr:HNH endonuclease [Polynucleobacter paneuropaeus]
MSQSFSLQKDKVIIYKDGESIEFKFDTVVGACLKVLINNQNQPMEVVKICEEADKIFASYNKPPFKDRGRDVRALYGKRNIVQKTSKGQYVFTGKFGKTNLSTFTPSLKKQILERDKYRCYSCGRSSSEGFELMIDHMVPESKGGKATLENGMVLCTRCNNIKSNYSAYTFGKKLFEKYLATARLNQNIEDEKFFQEVLKVFEKFNRD